MFALPDVGRQKPSRELSEYYRLHDGILSDFVEESLVFGVEVFMLQALI